MYKIKFSTLCIIFTLVFQLCCINVYAANSNAAKETKVSSHVAKYLPSKVTTSARIMEFSHPKKVQEINLKMQKALQANPKWMMEYIKKNAEVRPLPYHAKFGITKKEYDQLLNLSSKLVLVEKEKVKLSFIKNKDGSVAIKADKSELPINKIVILSNNAGVKTPYGLLNDFSNINNKAKNSPTGPWQGAQWKIEKITDMNSTPPAGYAVKFAIGALDSKKQGILYYDVKNTITREVFSNVIFYDL